MTDLSLLATVLAQGLAQGATGALPPTPALTAVDWETARLSASLRTASLTKRIVSLKQRVASPSKATAHEARLPLPVRPELQQAVTEFAYPAIASPRFSRQLYWQRFAALRSGRLYTRLPIDSFRDIWLRTTSTPTYSQWRRLLTLEAKAATYGQRKRRLSIMVGDSLSLWFPSDRLPSGQLWLNQALSGENTRDILQRLPDFDVARPQAIYVMAGVNDLKQGATDNDILWHLRQIVRRLQQAHPHARIVVQSILPTRIAAAPGDRIAWLNQRLAAIVQQDSAIFLDLYTQFADADGNLRHDLTTDGLHLNANGYATWQAALSQADIAPARGQ